MNNYSCGKMCITEWSKNHGERGIKMNHEYILTYDDSSKKSLYSWFLTEEEMNDFIDEKSDTIQIHDKLQILSARDI